MSPGQRQRPALADQADIGQRLLHGDAAAAALDDENEIEIAVADFGDRPGGRLAAEGRSDIRNACEIIPQVSLMQNPVVPLPLRHDDPIPFYLSMIFSENRFTLSGSCSHMGRIVPPVPGSSSRSRPFF